VDDIDRKLVELLRASGRATYAELARTVGLSAPAVHERVNKLETQRIITGYHAEVDHTAVGLGVTALVGVQGADWTADNALVDTLAALPQVEDCMFVAGDESYVLKVRVADMEELEETLMTITRIKGVTRTRTTIVISTKWEGRSPALRPRDGASQDETPDDTDPGRPAGPGQNG